MSEHHTEDLAIGNFEGIVVSIGAAAFTANLTGVDGLVELTGYEIAIASISPHQTNHLRPGAPFRLVAVAERHEIEFVEE